MARDFLAGLIGRAFEQVPVLEKRRASLFEPERGVARGLTEYGEEAEERPEFRGLRMESRRATEPEMENESRGRAVRDEGVPATASDEVSKAHEADAVPVLKRRERGRDEALAATLESRRATGRDTEQPAREPSIERVIERTLETQSTVVERHEIRTERGGQAQARSADTQRGTAKAPSVAPAASKEKQEGGARVKEEPTAFPERRVVAREMDALAGSRTGPRMAARSGPAPVRVAAPELPTIQVTIGRIELLAPQANAAPRPVAKPSIAPKLGLDAYLAERTGGKP